MPVRTVFAEDNLLVRVGLNALLSEQADVDVVGSASGYDDLVSCVHRLQPDVVVTDVRMPPTFTDEGVRAAVELRHRYPSLGVVVLTQFIDPGYLATLISDGSNGRGYLLKERVATPGELAGAIRSVAAGGSVIDRLVVDALVNAGMRSRRSPMQRLTNRERETLARVAEGKSNAAIAAEFVVTERVVEKHINSIFGKLDLVDDRDSNRRVKAVLMFLDGASRGE